MKLTKEALKQIIKEELEAVMNEGLGGVDGLISYIKDVNADRQTKDAAIEAVMNLSSKLSEFDDAWAERTAEKMSKADPEKFLASLINFANNELEM